MSNETIISTAIAKLRGELAAFKPGQRIYDEIVAPRDQVFAEYQPIFSPEHVEQITRDEFTSFLYFENNRHWSGLHRQGLRAAEDMDTLRGSLALLLDEGRPIAERFPEALQMVSGFGKGIASAILTVAYPDRYGVWNNTSEAGLRQLGAWPSFEWGEGPGGRYERINGVLLELSTGLRIDLWTLDAAWWFLVAPDRLPAGVEARSESAGFTPSFALERQLEEFLLENWSRTPLGEEWMVFSTEDDPEAGNQFPTDVGPIDILAAHKTEPRLLVIELKRNQSTDKTIGQALRYMGWVRQHLATDGQRVEALIIAHKPDRAARYALSATSDVRMMTYEVDFRLHPLDPLQS